MHQVATCQLTAILVYLFIYLSAGLLAISHKKLQADSAEIFREG